MSWQDESRRRARRRCGRVAALAVLLGGAPLAPASGVDGAGHVVVVPLVYAGQERVSVVTLTNPSPERIRITGTYVGAEGTPQAASAKGPIACPEITVDPDQSLTLPLPTLCPDVRIPDVENFGYLELVSHGDAHFTFLATSTTPTARDTIFGVPGQPVGAFDPGQPLGQPSLRMIGLRGDVPAGDETLACYFASLDEPKKVELLLWDASGALLGSGLTLALDPRRMERVDVLPAFGLSGHHEGLRLEVASNDPSLVVAGCGFERRTTLTVAYQPAQTPAPLDRTRLREAFAETEMIPGPYHVGYKWDSALLGGLSRKVTISTYLQPDDQVRCFLEIPSIYNGWDPRFWLELQVRDPKGNPIAGGNRATDTGVFSTGPRGRYPAASSQRFYVEVSYDEDSHAQQAWPSNYHWGGWAVRCQSAAGMSALLPVDDPTSSDDF